MQPSSFFPQSKQWTLQLNLKTGLFCSVNSRPAWWAGEKPPFYWAGRSCAQSVSAGSHSGHLMQSSNWYLWQRSLSACGLRTGFYQLSTLALSWKNYFQFIFEVGGLCNDFVLHLSEPWPSREQKVLLLQNCMMVLWYVDDWGMWKLCC